MHSPHALRRGQRNAFSLIELLIALAVIALLAAILLPAISRTRQSASLSKDTANLRQLAVASIMYASDKGILPPTYATLNPDGSRVTNTAWWLELFPMYVDTPEAFSSPFDETGYQPETRGTWTRNGITYREAKVSYGAVGHSSADSDQKASGRALGNLPDTSRIALYTNFQHENKRLSQTWFGQHPRWVSEVTWVYNDGTQANIAFVDGHVALMSRSEINEAIRNGTLNFGTTSY